MATKKGGNTKKKEKAGKRYIKEEYNEGGTQITAVYLKGPKGGRTRLGATLEGGTDLPRGKSGRLGGIKETPMFKALRKRGFSESEAEGMVKSQRRDGGGGFSILQGKGRKTGKKSGGSSPISK